MPKSRAEIIRLLFADPGKELHLRELARLSDLAVRTLQNELAKLAAEELLLSRRDGNRLYFRANPAHPIYPELRSLARKACGLRERLAEALAGLERASVAFVFGSLASASETARSDVDLMVVGDVGLRELAPRLRGLAAELGREINPATFSAASFRAKARAGDAFIRGVLEAPKIFIIGDSDELGRLA